MKYNPIEKYFSYIIALKIPNFFFSSLNYSNFLNKSILNLNEIIKIIPLLENNSYKKI